MKLTQAPTFDQISLVHQRIQPYIHRTPVLTSSAINQLSEADIHFKCENFQKIGAFKMRGAANAILALSDAERAKGVATHSSGNHAQAVALSAKNHGVKAYIVMPENAPSIKRAATAGYGAKIITCAPTLEARESTLAEVVAKTGATFLHPYNNYDVIAGQATCAKELIEEVPDLEVVMAPVGGGGLMSGTALTTKHLLPNAQIIGGEPKWADDAYRSFKSGTMQYNQRVDTVADGLRTNLGPYTFKIISTHLDDIITVSEEEIIVAMRIIWERMKIIIEPSCSVPFAAVLQQKDRFKGKKIGVILTGGNVDVNNLPF
ncbi:MAG: threonine/serine dehydratase [Bacteroidota bacterium]